MKITKTDWNINNPEITLDEFCSQSESFEHDQPGFGFEIGWNTSNILKPFLYIWFWRTRIQIGWLA